MPNTSNELMSTTNPTVSYTYDNNGSVLTKSDGTQYTWDYENELTQVVLPTGGTVNFKYDPFGRRIQKSFTQSGTTTTTDYLYDGFNRVEDVDVNGNLLARYVHGRDEPLEQIASGTTSYYQQDGLGSVTSLSSTAGALGNNTYTYDSYGNTTTSASVVNPFRYTGREFDAETGIYYYRARYYDQSVGRFLSEDPSGPNGGLNLYDYVVNNPINLYDPTGLRGSPTCGPNAIYCICCRGGKLTICNRSGGDYSGWVSDCMRRHEQQHMNDMTGCGQNPCDGKPDGPLTVSTTEKSRLECSAYRAELKCLEPAPRTKEIEDRRMFIRKQITRYCGGG